MSDDESIDKSHWGELLFAGPLEKRGMSTFKNWKHRYFELYERRLVFYHSIVSHTHYYTRKHNGNKTLQTRH